MSEIAVWKNKNGRVLSEETISDLVGKYDTPLFVIVRDSIIRNFRAFKKYFPGVEPFYAVKANPHPSIVQVLHEEGSSFDVASKNEIELALRCGVSPGNLIFANTIKRKKGIRFAKEMGVSLFTFDNDNEIGKMASIFPGAEVLLRLKTASEGSRINLSYKFGAEEQEAMELLRKARGAGLRPVGFSFHVGSPCHNPHNYTVTLQVVENLVSEAAAEGFELKVVDIGGGFPLHLTRDENPVESVESMAEAVFPHLSECMRRGIRVIAEPGRCLVGSACVLITKVIGKARRSGRYWYYLDDGIYGTFSAVPFDKATFDFHTFHRDVPLEPCVLAGPTCDSLDVIAEDVLIPPLELDDKIIVEDIGAYSWASATAFNGFEKPTVVLV